MLKGKCPHGAVCVDAFGYFSDCPVKTAESEELSAQSGEAPVQQLKRTIELLKRAQSDLIALDFDNGNSADLVAAIDNFCSNGAHLANRCCDQGRSEVI